MKRNLKIVFPVVFLVVLSAAAGQTPEKKQAWDGSQAVPVHQIPLKDEFDQPIIPTEPYPLPFSSRFTCAPCHDYSVVAQGLHFGTFESVRQGRPGEPWFWVEKKSGVVLPLSYQGWEGTWHPRQLGISSWEFALLFGRHTTGGGILEPAESEMVPESRWNVSGKVEINCMACHNASRIQSHSEWAKQILRHNFRWAATAASGLGEVGGMASRLSGTWDIFDGPNLDDTEWAVAPFVRYNAGLFDSKHRVFFDIADKPDDGRCLVCHSVTPTGMPRMELDADVHSAAGLRCVNCHRNGIDHDMIRGYEGETAEISAMSSENLTCSGCHLGTDRKKRGRSAGRLGAPFPRHRGLPAVHLERLSCTLCHSGPRPQKDPTRVRTSRANRLGIYGVAQWATDMPQILEPVYIKVDKGKITPHRLVWPSFWVELAEGEVKPLRPDEVLAGAESVFASEERVARLLLALFREPELGGTPVLLTSGKLFMLNVDGGLDVEVFQVEQNIQEMEWGVKTEDGILPLIPEFDPKEEMLDIEVEDRILRVFDVLETYEFAPGKPALIIQDVMYQSVEGYLEKMANPGENRPLPWLCWLVEGQPQSLIEEFDRRTVTALTGLEQTLTEEMIRRALEALDQNRIPEDSEKEGRYGYITSGLMFLLDEDGELTTTVHDSAEPARWPLAHRVRPAQQSLGINGCRDCHSANSPFFFGKVRGAGPLVTQKVKVLSQGALMGLTRPYQRLFGLSFSVRPVFKVVLFVSAVVLGSVLLILFLLALGRVTGLVEKR